MNWDAVISSLDAHATEVIAEMTPTLSFERTVAKGIEANIVIALARALNAGVMSSEHPTPESFKRSNTARYA